MPKSTILCYPEVVIACMNALKYLGSVSFSFGVKKKKKIIKDQLQKVGVQGCLQKLLIEVAR